MCFELLIRSLITFKRYNGTYFWSIVLCSCGLTLFTTSKIIIIFVKDIPFINNLVLLEVGWVLVTNGFTLVLWSRLHLVLRERRFLNLLLLIIILSGISGHVYRITTLFLDVTRGTHSSKNPWLMYNVEDAFISSLYIFYTIRLLEASSSARRRRVVALAVSVQIAVILMETALAIFYYTEIYLLSDMLTSFFKAIELRMEFVVLNQLQELFSGDQQRLKLMPILDFENTNPQRPTSIVQEHTAVTTSLTATRYLRSARSGSNIAVGCCEDNDNIERLERQYLGNWDEKETTP